MKPILICLCGPSAAGKDTLLKKITQSFAYTEYKNRFHILVSDTTRPTRTGEISGQDYNFVTEAEFQDKLKNNGYLETTEFHGWHYGTPAAGIEDDNIYIGIFNPEGVENMYYEYFKTCDILIYYIKAPFLIRLWRSIKREKRFRWEFIRRAFTDRRDFKRFERSGVPHSTFDYRTQSDMMRIQLLQIYLDTTTLLTTIKKNGKI